MLYVFLHFIQLDAQLWESRKWCFPFSHSTNLQLQLALQLDMCDTISCAPLWLKLSFNYGEGVSSLVGSFIVCVQSVSASSQYSDCEVTFG